MSPSHTDAGSTEPSNAPVRGPRWVQHAIWWHVYPLGAVGAPIHRWDREADAAPRLAHLIAWLDYAVELGVSGLLLGPIFDSATHGYDSLDQFRIDPRLGGEEEFDELVAACRERGLRVVLDGVFSHVGAEHPLVRRALQEGPGFAEAGLFDIDWDASGGPTPRVFEGHGALVRLDHDGEQAADYTARVMEHWLDRGIDGWRLDAAYSVPAAFWSRALDRVRRRHPDAWFLGEVIHGDYTEFVTASGVDSVTQYELWKAIWSSLSTRNFFELDWTLQRHGEFLERFTPNTFVGNHDVTRIATAVGADAAVAALAILLTVGGIPSIYYGDEQAFTGQKEERAGGDDAVRPALPDSPAELSPLGAGVHRAHQELIGLRRRHPWLVTARTETLHLENERCTYRVTAADASAHLEVELSLVDGVTVQVRDAEGTVLWQHGA